MHMSKRCVVPVDLWSAKCGVLTFLEEKPGVNALYAV